MRQGQRLAEAERADWHRRIEGGETYARAAEGVGCSTKTIQRWLGGAGGTKVRRTPRALLRLSLAEREEISRGLGAGHPLTRIAAQLGRSVSTHNGTARQLLKRWNST